MNIQSLKSILDCRIVADRLGISQENCFKGHDTRSGKSFKLHKDYFICWNCGVKGDAIKLVQDVKNIEFKQALHWLTQQFAPYLLDETKPVDNTQDILFKVIELSKIAWEKHPNKKRMQDYLIQKRGFIPTEIGFADPKIKDKLLEKYSVKELKQAKVLGETENFYIAGRIILPVYYKDRLLGYVARSLDGKHPKTINNINADYNSFMYSLNVGKSICVCEGDLDTLKVQLAGYNSCGLLGLHISQERLELFKPFEEINLFLDQDSAGDKGVCKFFFEAMKIKELRAKPIYVCKLPYNKKDPCDCTIEEIRQAFERRESIVAYAVKVCLPNETGQALWKAHEFLNNIHDELTRTFVEDVVRVELAKISKGGMK